MGYGDEILAAGQAQRWWEQHKQLSVIVDRDGRPRAHPIWDGNPCIAQPRMRITDDLHRIVNGPHCRPYIVYPFTLQTGWVFNKAFHARDHVAKIYLTPEELQAGRAVRAGGPFVLIDPWSKHENLRWPIGHWQALIASRPDLRWVQHHWDNAPRLDSIDVVETSSFRAACGVLAAASLYVRGESGMCHAAAALGIPQVTIWGGCMDWDVLGGYPKQFGLVSDNGPCGRYAPCLHCERVMHQITVPLVSSAISAQLERHGLR